MILYDLIALQPQSSAFKHGGGTYATLVLKRMLERSIRFAAFYDSRRYLDEEISNALYERSIDIYDIAVESFDDIVRKLDSPVVFSVLPKPYMLVTKTIGNIHDCRELELPNDKWEIYYGIKFKPLLIKLYRYFFEKKYFLRQKEKMLPLLNSQNFVCVTPTFYSKYKLSVFFPEMDLSGIKVFNTPISLNDTCIEKSDKEKYFLMVSGNRWLKNNLRAIVALDRLFDRGKLEGFDVVITGVKDLSIFKKKISHPERFRTCGYIDDNNLQSLYSKSYCFIYPSLNEGFGIPPLEAMRYGTPVIATNLASVPEVCGDAVIYVDPFSIEDIMSKILMVAEETEIYHSLQDKALEHYRRMIKKTIQDTDNYIDYVISESKISKY